MQGTLILKGIKEISLVVQCIWPINYKPNILQVQWILMIELFSIELEFPLSADQLAKRWISFSWMMMVSCTASTNKKKKPHHGPCSSLFSALFKTQYFIISKTFTWLLANVLPDHRSCQQISQPLPKCSYKNYVACHYNENNFQI